jgi:hypothetical protein
MNKENWVCACKAYIINKEESKPKLGKDKELAF